MNKVIKEFRKIVYQRSIENARALEAMKSELGNMVSPAFSILRQELDSFIRVIFLLSIKNRTERQRLMQATLDGQKWRVLTNKGKWRDVTDKEMVELSNRLHGWTGRVYKFGCAFIHLSDLHNHLSKDPFQKLSEVEKQDILAHLRNTHRWDESDSLTVEKFISDLPYIFGKIGGVMDCYLDYLEQDKVLDEDEFISSN